MNENTQRIEILTVRDPDESTVVRMFIDGVEVEGYAEVSVDPGAGHMLSDWRASQAEILAGDYSEGFKTAALVRLGVPVHAGDPTHGARLGDDHHVRA